MQFICYFVCRFSIKLVVVFYNVLYTVVNKYNNHTAVIGVQLLGHW